jgi:hypothetical protein
MSSHAELAAKLLREAAKFYRAVSEGNPDLSAKLSESARVYESVATLVETDPTGEINGSDEG